MDAMALFEKAMLSYDDRVGSNDMFYYNLPYERDYDLCNSIPIANYSGNVIKFYQYRLDKPVIIFTDTVDTEYQTVAEDEPADEDLPGMDEEDMIEGEAAELSDEEMAALLTEDSDDGEGEPSDIDLEAEQAEPVEDMTEGEDFSDDGVDDYDFTDFSETEDA